MELSVVTRNDGLTDAQSDLIEPLLASGHYQNAGGALSADLRLLERAGAEITALRDRLAKGFDQARSGNLAEGNGADAIRRAFAQAKGHRGGSS